jgi:ferredoxin-NADP reductase
VTLGSNSAIRVTEPAEDATRAPTGDWRRAIVREISHPSSRAVILRLDVPDRIQHWPGQHYVIRLTAEDGYTAQRSYSVASPPSDPLLEFYVERLEDGEVSSFLADVVEVGDELEVRGPIGGWFVWTADTPMFGVAGGSGVVPFVSMLRHAKHVGGADLMTLVVAARTLADLPYAEEFTDAAALIILSREAARDAAPDGRNRPAGRITTADFAPVLPTEGTCFICGSASFSGAVTEMLTGLGVDVHRIRIESFGPTG